jgi:hypothetical protein
LCRWAEYYSARLNELYSSGNENSDADESVEKQVENKDSSQTVSAIHYLLCTSLFCAFAVETKPE